MYFLFLNGQKNYSCFAHTYKISVSALIHMTLNEETHIHTKRKKTFNYFFFSPISLLVQNEIMHGIYIVIYYTMQPLSQLHILYELPTFISIRILFIYNQFLVIIKYYKYRGISNTTFRILHDITFLYTIVFKK